MNVHVGIFQPSLKPYKTLAEFWFSELNRYFIENRRWVSLIHITTRWHRGGTEKNEMSLLPEKDWSWVFFFKTVFVNPTKKSNILATYLNEEKKTFTALEIVKFYSYLKSK